MRFKVKTITLKMYMAKDYPQWGWWGDKEQLKRRIRNHKRGKHLALLMELKRKGKRKPKL